LGVGEFIWSGGDCHIYTNHVDAVKQQLIRTTRALPVLSIREDRKLGEYEVDDFKLIGYDPYDTIKADMAV
jgi:thymidylate synthase